MRIPLPPLSRGAPKDEALLEALGVGRDLPQPVTAATELRDTMPPGVMGDALENRITYTPQEVGDLISSGLYPDLEDEIIGELDNYMFGRLQEQLRNEQSVPGEDIMSSLGMDRAGIEPGLAESLMRTREQYMLSGDPAAGEDYRNVLNSVITRGGLAKDSPVMSMAALLAQLHTYRTGDFPPSQMGNLLQPTLQQAEYILGSATGKRDDEIPRLLNNIISKAVPNSNAVTRADQQGGGMMRMQGDMDPASQGQYEAVGGALQDPQMTQLEGSLTAMNRLEGDIASGQRPGPTTRPEAVGMAQEELDKIAQIMYMMFGQRRPPIDANQMVGE